MSNGHTTDEREPPPNDHWCKGCNPDNCPGCRSPAPPADRFRRAVRAAAIRAGLLHSDAPLTDDQLLLLLQNVADAAHYARACHS